MKIKNKNLFFSILCLSIFCFAFISCKTIDFEEVNKIEIEEENKEEEKTTENRVESSKENKTVLENKNENKKNIIPIFITPPEIRFTESLSEELEEIENKSLIGDEALLQHMKDKTVLPEYKDGKLKGWLYREESIYEVHCMTYHSTIIQLEPGEKMLEVPYISEPDVWRIARGVGVKNGMECEHLIIKPDFTKLISTLIIITDRRVYQIELKSYKDHYMPYVRWYYQENADRPSWYNYKMREKELAEKQATRGEFVSFDYTMSYSTFKTAPQWLPTSVYDDGAKTYIVLDKRVLHSSIPAVFKNNKDVINYEVNENVIVINQLVEKITLKLDGDSVTIKKKKQK